MQECTFTPEINPMYFFTNKTEARLSFITEKPTGLRTNISTSSSTTHTVWRRMLIYFTEESPLTLTTIPKPSATKSPNST